MVTQQILVLLFLVRIQVAQLKKVSDSSETFFVFARTAPPTKSGGTPLLPPRPSPASRTRGGRTFSAPRRNKLRSMTGPAAGNRHLYNKKSGKANNLAGSDPYQSKRRKGSLRFIRASLRFH